MNVPISFERGFLLDCACYDRAPATLTLSEVEKRHIIKTIKAYGGNKTLAAKVLGIDRRTLYRKIARWGQR